MTTMSHSRDRRLDRLDRAREWDEAMVHIDRMIEWAVGSGRVDLLEAASIRLHILAAAPTRDDFAGGQWRPEPASPDDIEAARVFIGEIDAWHTNQPQPEGRGGF